MILHGEVFALNPDGVIERAIELGEAFFQVSETGEGDPNPYTVRVLLVEPVLEIEDGNEEGPPISAVSGFKAEILVGCRPYTDDTDWRIVYDLLDR